MIRIRLYREGGWYVESANKKRIQKKEKRGKRIQKRKRKRKKEYKKEKGKKERE
jgi:hypothetical protein